MAQPPKKISPQDYFNAGARHAKENKDIGLGGAVSAGLNFGTMGLSEPMQARLFMAKNHLPDNQYENALQFVKGMNSEGFKEHPYIGTGSGIVTSIAGSKGLNAAAEGVGRGVQGAKYTVDAATKGKKAADAVKAANAAKKAQTAVKAKTAYDASGKAGKFTKNVVSTVKKDIIPMAAVGGVSGALNTPKNPVKGALVGSATAAASTPVGAAAGQIVGDTLRTSTGAIRQLALRNSPNFDKLNAYDKMAVISSVLRTAPKELSKAYSDLQKRFGDDPVAIAGAFDATTAANFKKEIGVRSTEAPSISNKNVLAERNKLPQRMNRAVQKSMSDTGKSAGDTVANLREQNNRMVGDFKNTYGDTTGYVRIPDSKQRYDIKGHATQQGDNISGKDVSSALVSSIERHPSDLGRNSRYLKNSEDNFYNRDWSGIDEAIYRSGKYNGLPLADARMAFLAENGIGVASLPIEAHAGRISDFDNLRQSMRPNNLLKDTQKKNLNTAANYLVENLKTPDKNITAEAWRNMLKNFGQNEQRISGVEYGRGLKNPDTLKRIQDINDLSSSYGRQGISEGVLQNLIEDSATPSGASRLMRDAALRQAEFRPNTISRDTNMGETLNIDPANKNAAYRESLGLGQRNQNPQIDSRVVGKYTGRSEGVSENPTIDPQNPDIIDAQYQDVNQNPYNDQGYVPRFVGEDFTKRLSDISQNMNNYYETLKQVSPASLKPEANATGDANATMALAYQVGGGSQTGWINQLIQAARSRFGMDESAARYVADILTNPARADEAVAILNAKKPINKLTGKPRGDFTASLFADHPLVRSIIQHIARGTVADHTYEPDPRLGDLSNNDAVQSYIDSENASQNPAPEPAPSVRVIPFDQPDQPAPEPAKKQENDPYAPVTDINSIQQAPRSPDEWQDNESWDQWQARIRSKNQ